MSFRSDELISQSTHKGGVQGGYMESQSTHKGGVQLEYRADIWSVHGPGHRDPL